MLGMPVRLGSKKQPGNVKLCKSKDSDWCRRHCTTGMSNYAKVRILIGVGDIAQQKMTAPIRIHYKVEGVPSFRGEIGRHSI